jgi:ribosomal protein S18 acetylase RimI-like enzyme
MHIRKATLTDISDIQRIARVTWNHTYEGIISKEAQDDFLKNTYSQESMVQRVQSSLLLVAEVENKVVGFANFSTVNPENNSATLGAIYIYPRFQNRKIGSLLLEKGLKELSGATIIIVDVEKDNNIGKTFYDSKGFIVEREYTEEFFGHKINTIQMSLSL